MDLGSHYNCLAPTTIAIIWQSIASQSVFLFLYLHSFSSLPLSLSDLLSSIFNRHFQSGHFCNVWQRSVDLQSCVWSFLRMHKHASKHQNKLASFFEAEFIHWNAVIKVCTPYTIVIPFQFCHYGNETTQFVSCYERRSNFSRHNKKLNTCDVELLWHLNNQKYARYTWLTARKCSELHWRQYIPRIPVT